MWSRCHYLGTVLVIALASSVESANILAIFPTASYSHQMPLLAVARSLAERGHNLTVITPNPSKKPIPNYTDIDISFSYDYWRPKDGKAPLVNLQQRLGPLDVLKTFTTVIYVGVELQLNSTPVQNFIKYIDTEKPTFDLVLYEGLLHTAYLGFLPKVGNPPLVSLTTLALPCGMDFTFANICNPSYVPDVVMGFTNQMTFLERVQNYVFVFFMHTYLNRVVLNGQAELAEKYLGLTSPTPEDILRNQSLLLLTSSWLYQYPRPVFPNTINIGPTHIGETKPLPQDLETWINGAEQGVIYFSLGSNMRSASLEESKRSAILTAFTRFPQHRIIWKWEEEELPGLPSNVICRKWLPQHDLLAHPKVKLFITQGGLQSLQESVYFEVPMIGIPFFGDQDYNVKFLQRLGVGNFIHLDDISSDRLYGTMKEILYNSSYTENMKRVSALSKTQMMSPRDSAVWWVEYVLKAGGNVRHLQPEYYHLTWYQYLGLDVLLFLMTPVILVLYGLFKIVSMCRRKLTTMKLKKS